METSGNEMETMENAPGNSKNRCVPATRWRFTSYEWDLETWETLFLKFKCKYIVADEICPSTNRAHIQGYFESPVKVRPTEKFKTKKSRFFKCTKSELANVNYCSKEGRRILTNIEMRQPIHNPLEGRILYDWQKKILDILINPPDDRTIYWFWDTRGNRGKTSLCKHICMTRQAIYLSGKSADIKACISEYVKTKDLHIALFDFVRSTEEYISYEALEAVKNGIFFSGKYESQMCMFNSPHIICFANFPPDYNKLSKDRWKVECLDEEMEFVEED